MASYVRTPLINFARNLFPIRLPEIHQIRNSSFYSVKHIKLTYDHTGVEVSKSPEEWKYVEKYLPMKCVPPLKLKDEYPSGFIPPREEAKQLPYFIRRTRNHMLNVFLCIPARERGMIRFTYIRKIEGDIWALHDDLKKFLLRNMTEKYLNMRVHEYHCKVSIRGDYVSLVKQWALSKGF